MEIEFTQEGNLEELI